MFVGQIEQSSKVEYKGESTRQGHLARQRGRTMGEAKAVSLQVSASGCIVFLIVEQIRHAVHLMLGCTLNKSTLLMS